MYVLFGSTRYILISVEILVGVRNVSSAYVASQH
jgi:hypothetical protein